MKSKLSTRLVLTSLFSMLTLSILVLTIFSIRFTSSVLQEQKNEYVKRVIVLTDRYSAWWDNYLRLGETFIRVVETFEGDIPQIVNWLAIEQDSFYSRNTDVENLMLITDDGIMYKGDGSSQSLEGLNDVYKRINKANFIIGDPLISPVSKKPAIPLYFCKTLKNGRAYCIAIAIKLDRALDLISDTLEKDESAQLFSSNGLLLGDSDPTIILKETTQSQAELDTSGKLAAIYQNMLSKQSAFETYNNADVETFKV